MQNIFNTLINSFIEENVGIADDFLNNTLASQLTQNLNNLFANNQLMKAGTGNNREAVQDKSFRGDKIFWLDRKHDTAGEKDFFDLMDSFVRYLNSTCYTGITGYEFHYTLYEKGSFYKKHLDQFRNNSSRQFSMIMYLNKDWKEADGGELCIHHEKSQQKISPNNGKTVFFKSNEIEHEVLETQVSRLSITGWLKID